MNYGNINSRFEILDLETAEEQKERRLKEKNERKKKLKQIEYNGCCEGMRGPCPNIKNLEWVPSRTQYSWDIDKYPLEDPNRLLFLCPDCAVEYNLNWDEMWEEYYATRFGY